MHKITPKHLAVAGCLAFACGAPDTSAPANPQSQYVVQEARAEFAPDNKKSRTRADATATLKTVGKQSKTVGTLKLAQRGDMVTMTGNFRGLPGGEHGIQIRAEAECSEAIKSSAEHYNPTDTRHGPPDSSRRHVGDLGNIAVDQNGKATFTMKTDSMTLIEDGPSSVLGRTIVITKNKDDGRSQPHGNAGPAIVCGEIRAR